MNSNTGCLSFFTVNHSNHDKIWLRKGDHFVLVCFACLVEIIEEKNEPSIRKTQTLQEMLKLTKNGEFLEILLGNEKILMHLLSCLWEILEPQNKTASQVSFAVEIIHQLCFTLKSEAFVSTVVDKIISTLTTAQNVLKIIAHLDLLGKLLQSIPGLTETIIHHDVVSILGKWTSYPEEIVRSSLFFILTHLYRNQTCCMKTPLETTEMVLRDCCDVLLTAVSEKLQINSIAFLQSLTKKENFVNLSKAMTCNKDKILTCLKKALLSPVELVQTIAVHCTNALLEIDQTVINSDLPCFIFEVFSSKGDALVVLGLKTISSLLDFTEMYSKGHVVYGFDTLISVLWTTAETKNFEMLKEGYAVLRKIFENSPRELQLIYNQDKFMKCVDVIKIGLINFDDTVALRATKCLEMILDRRHYRCELPYDELRGLVDLTGRKLETIFGENNEQWSRVENKG